MTAHFFFGRPRKSAAHANSAVTPERRFAPDLFASTSFPDSVSAVSSMFAVVVFPLVPVTTMISIPSEVVSRTCFENFRATLPGRAVPPPLPERRRKARTALQAATAMIVFKMNGFLCILNTLNTDFALF